MRKLTAFSAVLALAVAMPLAAQGDPAALVIRVQGDVMVTHADGAASAAAIGERMFVGDEVAPAPGARAILITRSGGQQVVTASMTIAEPRGGGNPGMFERAMATLAQAASTDATAGGRQGMIRPIPGNTALVGPRNGLVVTATRPTFVWTASPGKSYDLMLRATTGGRPQIFEVGSDTTWTLPDDVPELEHGVTYAWTVFVGGRRGGRPQPQQEFRVIGLEESVQLQDFLDQITAFGLDPMGDGLFLTAVAYRDLGLFYDARSALDGIEEEGAMSPDLYMLKGEILSTLGREREARAAFDMADTVMR
jgi:hypothetical protein